MMLAAGLSENLAPFKNGNIYTTAIGVFPKFTLHAKLIVFPACSVESDIA